jgi:excisionase family DNA binding protein
MSKIATSSADSLSLQRGNGRPSPASVAGRHLTVTDVCDELGISKSTFYDWRAAHKAPCCIRLPNGSLRVRRADLDRWLQECEEPA